MNSNVLKGTVQNPRLGRIRCELQFLGGYSAKSKAWKDEVEIPMSEGIRCEFQCMKE